MYAARYAARLADPAPVIQVGMYAARLALIQHVGQGLSRCPGPGPPILITIK